MAAGRLVDKLDEAAGKFTEVDSVISPAIGALLIGYETARWLDVAFKFTEKSEGLMHLRRGFTIEPGERVLIVEDVTTTGMSAVKVASLVEIAGGKVQAVLSIVNRVAPKVEAFNSYRHHFLVEFKPKTYIPSRCPMCADGISLDHPGSTK
jgi:orotate phosphoribosyltransferase